MDVRTTFVWLIFLPWLLDTDAEWDGGTLLGRALRGRPGEHFCYRPRPIWFNSFRTHMYSMDFLCTWLLKAMRRVADAHFFLLFSSWRQVASGQGGHKTQWTCWRLFHNFIFSALFLSMFELTYQWIVIDDTGIKLACNNFWIICILP